MKVLVNGLGNIGTTLVHLLLRYDKQLGIKEVIGCKRTFNEWNRSELRILEEHGMHLLEYDREFEEIITEVDYIFETTSNGVGLKNKSIYESKRNLLGCSAQGSEKGFGIPFMSGINQEKIKGEKFVHVVSCNTHGSAAILNTFSGGDFSGIRSADFVVVRRSEDLGQHQRLVAANVVARHLDENIGTHHGIDVTDLLKTVGVNCEITSSDVTTPSQLMHAVRFNVELKEKSYLKNIDQQIGSNPFISTTSKFDSNAVFELGRRYGFQGRIFSQAIIVANNVLRNGNRIKGWAFVPQEGNTLISTLNAFTLQTGQGNLPGVIIDDLIQKNW